MSEKITPNTKAEPLLTKALNNLLKDADSKSFLAKSAQKIQKEVEKLDVFSKGSSTELTKKLRQLHDQLAEFQKRVNDINDDSNNPTVAKTLEPTVSESDSGQNPPTISQSNQIFAELGFTRQVDQLSLDDAIKNAKAAGKIIASDPKSAVIAQSNIDANAVKKLLE